jgi:hypothetical protein
LPYVRYFIKGLWKNHKERGWFGMVPLTRIMDTSKQGISAILVHFVNILLSYLTTILPRTSSNPCVWYFLNLLLDTTIGVYILYLWLRLVHSIASHFGLEDIETGYYGNPPKLWAWFKQFCVFVCSWILVKVTVFIFLALFPYLGDLIARVFVIFNGNTKAQVAFVMFIFPLIMNVIQGKISF